MAELVIEGLCKQYGGQAVLDDISLTVPDGGLTIVLGPSGCGKSTLLRLVAGLETPDRGNIRIGGRDVAGLAPKDRDLAMVFQSYALYPHMDVAGNLAFPLKMRGTPKDEITRRVQATAELLGLAGMLAKKPRELSGGQRQRVAIGRALVREPRLFLLDEPLSNLDAQLRAGMRVELARLHRRLGATMVYVTHDQVEAMTLGQEIVVLARGRVQQIAAPQEVYHRPANLFVAGFMGSPAMNLIPGRVTAGGGFRADGAPELRLALPAGAPLRPGEEITVGVRPEHLVPGGGDIPAELELIERVGSESVLHLKCGGQNLAARAEAGYRGRVGELVELGCAAEDLHLFRDGRRLDW